MSRLISVHCVKDVSEGLSLTEVEENDCNDTPVCDDNAHKVVCELSKIQALLMSAKTISKILLKLNGKKTRGRDKIYVTVVIINS